MTENKAFLGRGWSFPPEFIVGNSGIINGEGQTKLVEGVEDIEQSLGILLNTSLGERVMRPDFGCNMSDYLFNMQNPTTLGFLRDLVFNAILYHEPRIHLEEVEVSPSNGQEALEGRLSINISYKIRETNSRFNFVFDFYGNEALKII